MYKAEAASSQQPPGGGAGPQAPGDDKVVDAEFEEVDEKKKKSA
jgi:molecular chaperone DnaK